MMFFIILLFPWTASGQTPPIIVPPGGQVTFSVNLGPELAYTWVSFSAVVGSQSGGHPHGDGRPNGTFTPTCCGWTDDSGRFSTTFITTNIAGVYQVTESDAIPPDPVILVIAKVKDLFPAPEAAPYQLVGVLNHPANLPWNGTSNAVYLLQAIGYAFHTATGTINYGLNDMSLPWGGLFDIGPPYGPFWHTPHTYHREGLNADCPFQYLGQFQDLFRQIATAYGGNPEAHNGNHFHLTFAY